MMRILIVSEDQETIAPLREILESQGRDVVTASRMTGVVDIIERAEIDLVIADQQFSDGNGLDLIRGRCRRC